MKALMIVAHGSRSTAANEEVRRLTESIAAQCGSEFGRVRHAFLEIAGPDINEAVAALAEDGAAEISVFPCFLVDGSHVAADIPRLIDAARKTYPDIQFEILQHLGALDGLGDLILKQIMNRDA